MGSDLALEAEPHASDCANFMKSSNPTIYCNSKSCRMGRGNLVHEGSVVGSVHAGLEADSAGASVPLRSFDWRTERRSGLWNLAFLARGAEIMALSSGRGPTLYSPHTHPTPAHSEGIWLCSQSAKNVWCKGGAWWIRRRFGAGMPLHAEAPKCPVKVKWWFVSERTASWFSSGFDFKTV